MKNVKCSDDDDDSDTVRVKRDKVWVQGKIDEATDDYFARSRTAPTRGGWDPVFRQRIESKSQLKRAWMNTIQDIVEVAKVYNVDLKSINTMVDALDG